MPVGDGFPVPREAKRLPYSENRKFSGKSQFTEHPKRGSIRGLVSCFFLVTSFASTLVLHENTLPVLVHFARVLL